MSNIGLSFVIGGLVGSSFTSSLKTVSTGMVSLSDKIQNVAKTKIDIKELMNLSAAGKAGTNEFIVLENRLQKAGIKTNNLSSELGNLNKKLFQLKGAKAIQINITSNINKIQSEIMNARGLIATGAGAMGVITAHADVLQAQGEIASLGVGEEGINKITAAAKKFSTTFAGTTTPAFIRASYDIKSGISSLSDSGVAEFTRLAALTGQATKSTTADMTKLFAMGYGIFRKEFSSDEEFANKFSNLIAGSVQAFRTDGPDLIQGISNLGATATAMGVSLTEQLAIIGTSKEAFNSASDAATGYRAFLAGVGKAQKALGLEFTDAEGKMLPMTEILESIKEKYGDTMESVAAKDELKAAFGSEEAAKTVSALISKTESLRIAQNNLKKDMDEGTKTEDMAKAMQRGKELELLKQQFISLAESAGVILYPAFKLLAQGLGGIAKVAQYLMESCKPVGFALSFVAAGVMTVLVAIKVGTVAMLSFKTICLSIAGVLNFFGKTLTKNSIKTAIFTIRTKMSTAALWVKNIALKAVSLSAMGVGKTFSFLGRIFSFTAIKSYAMSAVMLIQRGAMLAITIATRSAAASQWLMNKAFFACPITWLIAGVVAIAAGAYLLIKNWDKVKVWFFGFWENLKSVCSAGVTFIGNLLSTVYKIILYPFSMASAAILSLFGVGGGIVGVFQDFWSSVKTVFSSGFEFIDKIAALSERLASGFFSVIDTVKGWFDGGEDKKIGIDVSKKLNILSIPNQQNQQTAPDNNVIEKYYGSQGLVAKSNTVNNAPNMAYTQQIIIQGNADKEQVVAALDEGRTAFERQYNEMTARQERLSYSGGY